MTFTDVKRDEWKVKLVVGSLADLRAAGLDLKKAMTSAEALTEVLFGDPENLVKALWVLCETQALDKKVTPEEFAHRFDGPALEMATEALLAAVADFFPRTRVGQEMRASQQQLLAEMDKRMAKAVRNQTERALASTSSPTAGASPGTPAKTRGRSRSAS